MAVDSMLALAPHQGMEHQTDSKPPSVQEFNFSESPYNSPSKVSLEYTPSHATTLSLYDTTPTELSRWGPHPRNVMDKLPFFGPPDPQRWPPEKVLFLLGFLLFPAWFIGACWGCKESDDSFAELFRWRCQVMSMIASIIITGLVVVEIAFRGK
ncbi:hypothetical protein A0H81_03935 [Grifola frondosa]|uniref:Uncharacterized protein n=1 Tax=Grifola frondosa TaxID=5627 RepID=A0A1C7MJX0_GRIFR|nr:hypothetical protein A0H81_03935 [Grifola frondosa]